MSYYNNLIDILKKIRAYLTSFWAEQTNEHLKEIRIFELISTLKVFPSTGKVLEIGAGTGWQAKILEDKGYAVSAIDVNTSRYKNAIVWDVKQYDGKKIPFDNNSFDIVYSSNVLEHIPHVKDFQKEIHRVLKTDGIAIHVLPSSSWRLWTIITGVLRLIKSPVHGEHAKTAVTEIYYFSINWWTKLFEKTKWTVSKVESVYLFHTGYSIMDKRLSIRLRHKLSYILGSACNLFILKK